MRSYLAMFVFPMLFAAAPIAAQQIQLPNEVVEGAPVTLQVRGLQPGSRVELLLRQVAQDGSRAEGRSVLRVATDGTLDPARDAALEGDYRGVDAAGPFWSMRPGAPSTANRGALQVSVRSGGAILAERTVPLRAFASAITVEDVAAFPGARLYRPDTPNRLPVIIVLGGSEGGTWGARLIAPRLAELGYAALALPYYNPPWTGEALAGLPPAFVDIPVDRLLAVKRWIDSRSDLDRRRIGLYGISKGGELAMLAAVRFPWLRAVIGIVPSDVVWEGWGTKDAEGTRSSFAWRGRPLAFVPYQGMSETIAALGRGESRSLTEPHLGGRRLHPDRVALARIPVERFRGAMMVVGGDLDSTWPSGEMVRAIAERRAAAGRVTVALSYSKAGHGLAGTGWMPINYAGADGTVAANAAAQQQIWAATRLFLERHLPSSTVQRFQ